MIRKLSIKNFRCYEESTITFNGTSILIGKNNAGKSTMIEALKIISTVTRKYRTSRFVAPPDWLRNVNNFGIAPNVENMNISDRGIFHLYGNPPALIEAGFSEGKVALVQLRIFFVKITLFQPPKIVKIMHFVMLFLSK